jgi:hypothetical protein
MVKSAEIRAVWHGYTEHFWHTTLVFSVAISCLHWLVCAHKRRVFISGLPEDR